MKCFFDEHFMILPTAKSTPVRIVYEGQPMTDKQRQEGIRKKFENLLDSIDIGMLTIS